MYSWRDICHPKVRSRLRRTETLGKDLLTAHLVCSRAKQAALAVASNWTWNFLLSFFTPFITSAIGYRVCFSISTNEMR